MTNINMTIRQRYNEEALMADPKANGGRGFQRCAASVLDTIHHPEIQFDEAGVSQYPGIYNRLSQALNTGK
jgi:hypothetical protein